MGTHTQDYYGQGANSHSDNSSTAAAGAARPTGSRGKITSRPSRDSILQSYAAQDAERARNARMYSQAVSQVYQEGSADRSERAAQRAALEKALREQEAAQAARRQAEREARARAAREGGAQKEQAAPRPRVRVVPPLSSQESYDRTRSSMESYERARASRDALSGSRRGRTTNREVIDGRGSIDSRAFNETHELVGYSIDERDKPRAAVDDSFASTRWHSRAGQGFSDVPDSGSARPGSQRAPRRSNVGLSGGVMSGRANYTPARGGVLGALAGLPLPVKIIVPILVVVLVIVLIVNFVL